MHALPSRSVHALPTIDAISAATAAASSDDAAAFPAVLDRPEAQARAERGRLTLELGNALEPAVVDDLRDEPADVGMHPARAARGRVPCRGGIVRFSPSRCSSTERPVPSGCVPCETCASCSGSPSSTTLRAAVPIASASASDTCPASSMTSVSTCAIERFVREEPRGAGEEQDIGTGVGEVVDLARVADRSRRRNTTQRLSFAAFLSPRNCSPSVFAALVHLVEQVVDRLVAGRRHADAPAVAHELRDEARAGPRLARARRPLDEQVAGIESERQRALLGDVGRLDVIARLPAADARRRPARGCRASAR